MKREGRQHGMVRSYRILPSPLNPRPNTRFVNKFDSPPTAGLFDRVSAKPTNHSKFTGKCGRPRCTGCHLHPACKSKEKTKGTQKLKSNDVALNAQLITWRVVDGRPGFQFSGLSATGMLDHLKNDYLEDEVVEDEQEVDYHGKDSYSFADLFNYDHGVEMRKLRYWNAQDDGDDHENGTTYDGNWASGDDVCISEMGFQMDQVEEDEDWCFVESCS